MYEKLAGGYGRSGNYANFVENWKLMTRFTAIMSTLCMSLSMSAQPGIINTRPANNPEGKMLTMEETILSQKLAPANLRCRWTDNGHIAMLRDGKWVKYDIQTGDTVKFIPQAQYPHAYNKGQNLYLRVQGTDGQTEDIIIAASEDKNISYGTAVSRHEFGINVGIFPSPDKSRIAFYRKDESKVTSFPLLDITTRTGSLKEIKYPMAGMESEIIDLGIYDIASGSILYVTVDEFTPERYLTNITWSPDNSKIFIQVLDRSQKHMKLNMYDAATGEFIKTILTEDNEKYVEPLDPLYFIKGQNDLFIYRTANRDGYRSLYLCDTDGNISRITTAEADIAYLSNDGKYIYYTSAEVSPVENHLFRICLKNLKKRTLGKPERLTEAPGWHVIAINPDCSHYTDTYSSLTVPGVTDLRTSDGKMVKNLLTAEDPTMDYAYTEISLGTVRSADDQYDNYYRLIKPKDFDPSKKYPVIVYVYGGPHSQMVQNTFTAQLRRWEMYMAQRGYLVYVQDNRGTQNRGLAFEQSIHGQCGQAEMADQMEGVKMLMELPYVDKDRIGVHGWSYGGFMTISLITNYPDIFKVAVAGGPVIDWKWYEVMYGERYMDNPDTNPEGYARTSLINKAKDLKGRLLICQGAIDPVVVWEHSLSFIRECIKNNVQVDYFPYPCAEHNVMGKDRVHLHDKISMYFEDYL